MSSISFTEESRESNQDEDQSSQDSSVDSKNACSQTEREHIAERKRKSMAVWKSRELNKEEHKSEKLVINYKFDNVARSRAFFKAQEANFKKSQSSYLRASASNLPDSPPLLPNQLLQSIRDLNKSTKDFHDLERRLELIPPSIKHQKSDHSDTIELEPEENFEKIDTNLLNRDLDTSATDELNTSVNNSNDKNHVDGGEEEHEEREKVNKESIKNDEQKKEEASLNGSTEIEEKAKPSALTKKDDFNNFEEDTLVKSETIDTPEDINEKKHNTSETNITSAKQTSDNDQSPENNEADKTIITVNNVKDFDDVDADKTIVVKSNSCDKKEDDIDQDDSTTNKHNTEQNEKHETNKVKSDHNESHQVDVQTKDHQEDSKTNITESPDNAENDQQETTEQEQEIDNTTVEKDKENDILLPKHEKAVLEETEAKDKPVDTNELNANNTNISKESKGTNELKQKGHQHKHSKTKSNDQKSKTREHRHKKSINLTVTEHQNDDECERTCVTKHSNHKKDNQENDVPLSDENLLGKQSSKQGKDEGNETANSLNAEATETSLSPRIKLTNKSDKEQRKSSEKSTSRKHSSSDAATKRIVSVPKAKAAITTEDLIEKQASDTELDATNGEKEKKEKERKRKKKERQYHTMRAGLESKPHKRRETLEPASQEKDDEVPILSSRRKERKNVSNTSSSKYSTVSIMKQTFSNAPITPQEKRKLILQEIYVSEEYYVQKLKLLVESVQKPLLDVAKTSKSIITPQQIAVLFSSPHLEIIYRYNSIILNELRKCKEEQDKSNEHVESVGTIFSKMSDFLKTYSFYSTQFQKMTQNYDTIMKGPLLDFVTKALQDAGESLDLLSLLIMPVQRVPRYVLLLKELLKCTDKDDPEYQKITDSLAKMENIATQLNAKQTDIENRKKLTKIQAMIVGANSLQLISPTRVLKREGPMFSLKGNSLEQVYVFLFNDLLVSTVDGKGTYRYKTSIEINDHTEVGSHLFAQTSEHRKRSGTLRKKTSKKDEKLPEQQTEEEEKKPGLSCVRNMFVLAGSKTSKKKSKFSTFSPGRNDGTGSDIIAFCGKDDEETKGWEALIKDLIKVHKLNKESFEK